MTLGEKLSCMRSKKGISQETLANSIGVLSQTVIDWEQNTAEPDRRDIIRLCEYFNVPLEYVVYDSVEKPSSKGKNKGIGFLIAGLALLFITVISTYPAKIYEYKILGSSFENELDYLTTFPFNLALIVALILLVIGIWKMVKGKNVHG